MRKGRHEAFERELALGRKRLASGDFEDAFTHLQRAHVIGQAFVGAHSRAHGLMLRLELRRRRPGAAFGQVLRLVLGMLGSAVGVVPVGNTGGSDISMFKRIPIPQELQQLIDS